MVNVYDRLGALVCNTRAGLVTIEFRKNEVLEDTGNAERPAALTADLPGRPHAWALDPDARKSVHKVSSPTGSRGQAPSLNWVALNPRKGRYGDFAVPLSALQGPVDVPGD